MTFENNIMESKKIMAKGMLLSVGVGMMMFYDTVYGTSGSSTPPAAKKIEDVFPTSKMDELLGKNKDFIQVIDDLKKNDDFEVKDETGFCCCKHKLDIMKVKIKNKSKNKSCDGVYALVYECLAVDESGGVKMKAVTSDDMSTITRIAAYFGCENRLDEINKAL